jgi:hypothetical protein
MEKKKGLGRRERSPDPRIIIRRCREPKRPKPSAILRNQNDYRMPGAGAGVGAGAGAVLQPPLPLQEFLPLHPWSLVLQPPWPLQAFWPLQACVPPSSRLTLAPGLRGTLVSDELADICLIICCPLLGMVEAVARTAEPASRPVIAAAAMSIFEDFISVPFCELSSHTK